MLIGYMRVSKADGSQILDLQRDALPTAGVASAKLYHDHASGIRNNRPGLDACLKSLRADDTLVVWKLDRLGRNLHHLVNLVHELTAQGINLQRRNLVVDCTSLHDVSTDTIYRALRDQFRPPLVASS